MKSKTPLVLIEQTIMILIFAVSAAVCLRVFAYSENMSRAMEIRDRAFVHAANTAEVLKNVHGDIGRASEILHAENDGRIMKYSDEDESYEFIVVSEKTESGTDKLGRATITVFCEGSEAAGLEVCWQED